MQVYDAPLRDMRFVLNELHVDDGFGEIPALSEFTPDLSEQLKNSMQRARRPLANVLKCWLMLIHLLKSMSLLATVQHNLEWKRTVPTEMA